MPLPSEDPSSSFSSLTNAQVSRFFEEGIPPWPTRPAPQGTQQEDDGGGAGGERRRPWDSGPGGHSRRRARVSVCVSLCVCVCLFCVCACVPRVWECGRCRCCAGVRGRERPGVEEPGAEETTRSAPASGHNTQGPQWLAQHTGTPRRDTPRERGWCDRGPGAEREGSAADVVSTQCSDFKQKKSIFQHK